MVDPSNPRIKIRTDYLAASIVTLAPLVFFLPALLEGLVLSPDDGILQNVPFRVAAAKIFWSGQLPLWNPYLFGGMPLLGAAQGGLLFPFNWFYLIFSAPVATNLMVLFTFMCAGLGAFLFARRTGSSVAGAVLTSLVWQAGGFLINQISHINIVQTAALLPLVLWSLEVYVDTGNRKSGVLLALLIALQVFAGHQQTFAYTSIVVGAYAIVMSFGNRGTRKLYLASLVFCAVGVLLAMVQILPTWELLRNSVRSTASYDFFTSFSMMKKFVMTFLAPFIMGGGDGRLFRAPYIGQSFYTEYVPYAGVLSIMLALVALIFKRDKQVKFWGVVVVVGLLLAFGRFAPLSLNRIVYFIPVFNLFRVPARHLLEVHFAVAVLAGRGLTYTLTSAARKKVWWIGLVTVVVVVLTWLTVTVFRPIEFQLARQAPVTILRAPELFMPLVFAVAGAFAVWNVARGRRHGTAILFLVLAADLLVWGQFCGWYASSRRIPNEYWQTPESVSLLKSKATGDPGSYRILTTHLPFDPGRSNPDDPGWVLWTEPDIYMMHGIQNAAGYDGFGLQRYSELAGQMKLWGALTDPNATLRSNSREIDILNTRYVIARHEREIKPATQDASLTPVSAFPVATENIGEFSFALDDLALPNIGSNKHLSLQIPPVEADRIALITNLSFAEDIPDNTIVARLHLRSQDGKTQEFTLRAGVETSDWAYDRPDIRSRIRHKRVQVATNYDVSDAAYKYKGHTYLCSFTFPERAIIESGSLDFEMLSETAGASLKVFRISLADTETGKTYPLAKAMLAVDNTNESQAQRTKGERWQLLAHGLDVNVYENTRALPRAWLASEVRVLNEQAILEVVRTGYLPDGSLWDPLNTALVEKDLPRGLQSVAAEKNVEVTRYEANRIDLKSNANGESFLVLSENDYPGWRAYVDGQVQDIVRANYALRGVVLPKGAHEISFRYRPWSVIVGASISLLSALGLIAFCWQDRFRGFRLK